MANTVDLFSYLPGLQVTQAEILEAEILCQQLLQSTYPDLDLREGTALRDTVLRPNATLLALLRKGTAYYFSQNTIDGITNATSTTFVDSLMSNWFLTRKQGSKAVINVRLFFARAKTISLPTDTFFSPDNTRKYFPQVYTTLPANGLTFDGSTNSYYVDVDLAAEASGKNYEISSGGLVYFTTFDPYFLRAEVNFLRQTASDTETNSTFVARAKAAISTRNLVNIPSISSRILQDFTNVKTLYSVGMNDLEMWRDQVQVIAPTVSDPAWLHVGGKVDIYCKTTLLTGLIQITLNSNGVGYLTGPIHKFSRSSISGGASADTVPLISTYVVSNPNAATHSIGSIVRSGTAATATLVDHGLLVGRYVTISGSTSGYNGVHLVISTPTKDTFTFAVDGALVTPSTGTISCTFTIPSKDVGFSNLQVLKLDFGNTHASQTASFNITYTQDIDGLQFYLSDPINKVVAGDYLARAFNMYELDVTVTGYNGPAPNSDLVMATLSAYVNSLPPGGVFVMSAALAALDNAGITFIRTPISINYNLYTRDLTTPISGTITDTLNPHDDTAIFVINSVTTNSTSL